MDSKEFCETITDFGIFDSPIRNIRLKLDGTYWEVELIPSVVVENAGSENIDGYSKEISEILSDAKPILEADRALRLEFFNVVATVIQEEFVSIFAEPKPYGAIKNEQGKDITSLNIYRVKNSKWREKLPDHEGGDNPALEHFKLLSMECCIDILGVLEKGEWVSN